MTSLEERLNNSWIWDIEDFSEPMQAIYLPARAIRIHIVAYRNKQDRTEDGRPPGNHWAFFVQVPNLEGRPNPVSIRFNMQSGESSKYGGNLFLKKTDYDLTKANVYYLSRDFIVTVTVRDIIDLIMREHLDCYKFTDNHEGCAYWTACVVRRFSQIGWLSVETSRDIENAIQYYFPDDNDKQPVSKSSQGFEGLIKGTFFTPN